MFTTRRTATFLRRLFVALDYDCAFLRRSMHRVSRQLRTNYEYSVKRLCTRPGSRSWGPNAAAAQGVVLYDSTPYSRPGTSCHLQMCDRHEQTMYYLSEWDTVLRWRSILVSFETICKSEFSHDISSAPSRRTEESCLRQRRPSCHDRPRSRRLPVASDMATSGHCTGGYCTRTFVPSRCGSCTGGTVLRPSKRSKSRSTKQQS